MPFEANYTNKPKQHKAFIDMTTPENKSQFIIYQTDNGQTKLDVRFMGETVWLTQQLMADLFNTSKQNIGQLLKNIFEEQEVVLKFKH